MNPTHTSGSVCCAMRDTTIYNMHDIKKEIITFGIKIFIFLWILIGAIFCLYALFTEKGKKLVNDSPLLETAIAIMYAMILSPYWLISGIIETLFKKG